MDQTNDFAIVFNNVYYEKNDKTIIKNMTGTIPRGKITAIVGPSGSGKTTVLKLCNSLIQPSSGEIFIENKKINEYDPKKLRRFVALALQEATMIDGTVLQNLSLPMTLQQKKLSDEEVHHLIQIVGLEAEMLSRHVRHLSGGQKQKLSLARTLVNQPNILLLDEITSSLDQISATEIEQLIRTINEKHQRTIVWITHNLQQAKEVAQYVWILIDGQLVESGSIDLLTEPESTEVKQFLRGKQ